MLKTCRFVVLGFLASLTVLSTLPAQAGLLVEPYFGYKFGTFKIETSNQNLSLSSPQVGARVGFTFPIIFVAADYGILVGGKFSNGTNLAPDGNAAEGQLFAEVGAILPLIRFYAGYGVLNTLTYTVNSVDYKAENGTAYKLGIGTTILPLVAINLTYVGSSYDKYGGTSAIKSSSGFYGVNLSIPFEL